MKLQGVSVIFALIVLPLILVLTYYIHLQVDTIEMQNEYDKKLLDSTYGAMSAFELNTANEDLSTVSDSLRTIIDASTNIFMNTLATNFGMSNASNSYLEPYIPAILYTLYDGYYISAPTRTPKILTDTDGNAVYVGDTGLTKSGTDYSFKMVHTNEESQNNCTDCILTKEPGTGRVTGATAGSEGHILYNDYIGMSESAKSNLQIKYAQLDNKEDYGQLLYLKRGTTNQYTTDVNHAELEIKHILKTYMPYSARYKDTNFDIVAIYTLDNYLTIEGTIKEGTQDVYYTKSGYFIPETSVEIANIDGKTTPTDTAILLNYNQNDAKKFIEDGNYVEIKLKDETTSGTILSAGILNVGIRLKELEDRTAIVDGYIEQLNAGNTVDVSVVDSWLNNSGASYVYTATDALNKAIEAKRFLSEDIENIKSKHSRARFRREIKNIK